MVYSDTSSLGGIIQTIERMTDAGQAYISGDDNRLKEMTATVNRINHRVLHIIFTATGNWQYDVGNFTDLPTATTDIVSGQASYALPSDALTVQRIEFKDKDGNWSVLKPTTKERIGEALDEFQSINGSLMYYTLMNGVINIYPASDYDSTGGLKVYFDRDSVDFAYNDTTQTPGFASTYHEIIPIKASIEWFKIKQPNSPTLALLIQDDLKLEKSIVEFYGKRFKNLKSKITRYSNYN